MNEETEGGSRRTQFELLEELGRQWREYFVSTDTASRRGHVHAFIEQLRCPWPAMVVIVFWMKCRPPAAPPSELLQAHIFFNN